MDFERLPDEKNRETVRDFAQRAVATTVAERDRAGRWDPHLFSRAQEAGLTAAIFPEEYGGGGQSPLAVSNLLEELGAGTDGGFAWALGTHVFTCGIPILHHGTAEQKRRLIPKLAKGGWLCTLAHHEAQAGSDPKGIETQAKARSDRWVLEGTKSWVVSGPVADAFLVTAVTDPSAGLDGISTFIVGSRSPGLKVGRTIQTVGMRTMTTCELVFEQCEIPTEDILGPEGGGLTQVLRTAQRWERAMMMAPWIGIQEALLERSVAWARERIQFGRALGQFQAVRTLIADMKIGLELGRRLQHRAAWSLDRTEGAVDRDIAVAKLFVSQVLQRSSRDALQIHGSVGLETSSFTERLYRDVVHLSTLGGSNEILKSMIAGSMLGLG